MNQKVILLFGLPRSGTTWIGKIFDSHRDTLYRHEPDSWGLLNATPLLPPADDFAEYTAAVKTFVSRLPGMNATKVSASLPIFAKHYYSLWGLQSRRIAVSAGKIGARLFGEFPVPAMVSGKTLETVPIVWKSIESVGRMGVVVRSLDNVSAILITRHPCGYVASVLRGEARHKFTGNVQASEDYGILERLMETKEAHAYGLKLAHLRSLHPVERLAWRWALFNEKAMADTSGREDSITVRYEDVCASPLEKAKELFEFVGLPWDDQTSTFIERSTSAEKAAYYSLTKNPVNAANKWREELAEEDIRRITKVVANTLPGKLYLEEPA